MPDEPAASWRTVVEQIQRGDPLGEETLYAQLNAGARQFLQRRLGSQDVEDRVHDVFLIVVQAIQRRELRDPDRLMGFVRTVLYRQLTLGISRIVGARETSADVSELDNLRNSGIDPEQNLLLQERVAGMTRELRKLKRKDSEILTRYYLREQPAERICAEMGLSQSQFLVRKSRAKARLAGFLRK